MADGLFGGVWKYVVIKMGRIKKKKMFFTKEMMFAKKSVIDRTQDLGAFGV